MTKIFNLPDFDKAKIGTLMSLELYSGEQIAGLVKFNTVNCSGYQIRNIYFPFLYEWKGSSIDWKNLGDPCIYGITKQLEEVYSPELIAKGEEYEPADKSNKPHILIRPPLKLDDFVQRKLLEMLVDEFPYILSDGQESRIFEESHNKKTFSKFPVKYLEELYGLDLSLESGDRYVFTHIKKYGYPSNERKEFQRFVKMVSSGN